MANADQATSGGPHRETHRPNLDPDSAEWVASLREMRNEQAVERLHGLLLRIARKELGRRSTGSRLCGPEIDDIAHQVTSDAVLLITRRIHEFRGESRFTTWAYKFVVFEVSSKLGRHFWTNPSRGLDPPDWNRLPDRFGVRPADAAETKDLIQAVRASVENCLTDRQREVFVAIVVEGVPLDALVDRMGTNRNAIYKVMFDARQKLRKDLAAGGYIDLEETT